MVGTVPMERCYNRVQLFSVSLGWYRLYRGLYFYTRRRHKGDVFFFSKFKSYSSLGTLTEGNSSPFPHPCPMNDFPQDIQSLTLSTLAGALVIYKNSPLGQSYLSDLRVTVGMEWKPVIHEFVIFCM